MHHATTAKESTVKNTHEFAKGFVVALVWVLIKRALSMCCQPVDRDAYKKYQRHSIFPPVSFARLCDGSYTVRIFIFRVELALEHVSLSHQLITLYDDMRDQFRTPAQLRALQRITQCSTVRLH